MSGLGKDILDYEAKYSRFFFSTVALKITQYRLPVRSAVIYLGYGAGRQDTGQHQHLGIDGQPVLTWSYSVVHLWRLQAEEILALNRSSLLPVIGFTCVQDPTITMPQVVAVIRSVPNSEEQITLLGQLLGLLQDDEVIGMTQQLLTQEDIEELKRFPCARRALRPAHVGVSYGGASPRRDRGRVATRRTLPSGAARPRLRGVRRLPPRRTGVSSCTLSPARPQ